MGIKDSEIKDISKLKVDNNSDEVYELIHTTSHSILYRMRRDGKYFIVKQSTLSDEKGRKILRREYEISIGLYHPNIVNIYEYRPDENFQDSIILEYVDGRTLTDFLSESPSFKTKKRIFSELLDAIDYLHQNRIIHNDVKPENIIISRTGNHLKLIDLGLSDDDVHYAVKSIGYTKGYSAPELINEGMSDVRSDIYSLGIIARLLFGKKYRGIYKKCLRDNPDKRFQDIPDLRKKWERLYWRWLGPSIIVAGAVIAFLIVLLVNDRNSQNNEREQLKAELSLQNMELAAQKQTFEDLKIRYNSLNDSITEAERTRVEMGKQRKEIIDRFSVQLQRMTQATIDSLRKSTDYFEMSPIRMHYMEKAWKFYESQNKTINGEDLSPQFYSILINEMSKVDKEFEKLLPKFTPEF